MESAPLGLVLDSSILIAAERRGTEIPDLIESIAAVHGNIRLSLPLVTVAELVHGIYRAKTPEISQRRRAYIAELIALAPVHPMTLQTAFTIERSRANKPPRETSSHSTISQ